ncbi:MAG TPA: TetR/AcrR family transcriptional regulator [Terriglobales bacterium]|jgi:AcrR family transcriptional regulator
MAVTKQNSETVSHRRKDGRKDERVRRTRGRIDAALVQLLHRRPYGDIRVSHITKKAGVGRATFYAHYAAKDDLLRSQFERIVAPMLIVSPDDPLLLDASRLFAHIGSAPYIYRALMGPSGGGAPRVLRDCFEACARKALALDQSGSGLKQSATSRFVASSLLTVIECWLEHGGHETPQQVQTLFKNLVGPGLRLQQARQAG